MLFAVLFQGLRRSGCVLVTAKSPAQAEEQATALMRDRGYRDVNHIQVRHIITRGPEGETALLGTWASKITASDLFDAGLSRGGRPVGSGMRHD